MMTLKCKACSEGPIGQRIGPRVGPRGFSGDTLEEALTLARIYGGWSIMQSDDPQAVVTGYTVVCPSGHGSEFLEVSG